MHTKWKIRVIKKSVQNKSDNGEFYDGKQSEQKKNKKRVKVVKVKTRVL